MFLGKAVIFLGPPGAGKGTQSKLIAKLYGVPHLSTGDMFRDAIARGTEMGRLAKPIMERGDLVPDSIVIKMVEERLELSDCAHGFVFDGFPRTLPQAVQLDRLLRKHGFGKPVVVDFELPREVLIRRLSGRWTCSLGGEIYNVHDAPPKVQGICDADGGKLIQRADDRPEAVKERLLVYDRQTKPLADYYGVQGVLEMIDAAASMDEVSRHIRDVLKRAESKDGHL